MERVRALKSLVGAVLVAVLLGGISVTPSAGAAAAVACSLVTPQALHSVLGLSHTFVFRDYDASVPTSQVRRTECGEGAWNGSAPTTLSAVLQAAKQGRAAQVGIETWAPNQGSPNVQDWLDKGYDDLTGLLIKDLLLGPGLPSARALHARIAHPAHLGYPATAVVATPRAGRLKGLAVAAGCWWDDKSSSAMCMFTEEAVGKPVLKHLNRFAKNAVQKFFS